MKIVVIAVFTFLYTHLCVTQIQAESLEKVLELHTRGMGGKEVIERIRSVRVDLAIQEPEFTVDAVYVADSDIRMRIDIYANEKRVFTEAFDGKRGWQMGEDGKVRDTTEIGTSALRNGIFLPGKFFGLHELPGLGHQLASEGTETVEGQSYHVIKLTLDSKKDVYLYIHPKTGWIEKTRDVKALHPDLDSAEKLTETTISDFRKMDGTVRGFLSVQKDLKTGKVLQTTRVKKIEFNPKLDSAIFQKPTSEPGD